MLTKYVRIWGNIGSLISAPHCICLLLIAGSGSENEVTYENPDEYYDFNGDDCDDTLDDDDDDVNPRVTSLLVCKSGDRFQRFLNDSGSSSCSLESHVSFETTRDKFSANTTPGQNNHVQLPETPVFCSGSSGGSPNARTPDSGISLSQNDFNSEIKIRLAKLKASTETTESAAWRPDEHMW